MPYSVTESEPGPREVTCPEGEHIDVVLLNVQVVKLSHKYVFTTVDLCFFQPHSEKLLIIVGGKQCRHYCSRL